MCLPQEQKPQKLVYCDFHQCYRATGQLGLIVLIVCAFFATDVYFLTSYLIVTVPNSSDTYLNMYY